MTLTRAGLMTRNPQGDGSGLDPTRWSDDAKDDGYADTPRIDGAQTRRS